MNPDHNCDASTNVNVTEERDRAGKEKEMSMAQEFNMSGSFSFLFLTLTCDFLKAPTTLCSCLCHVLAFILLFSPSFCSSHVTDLDIAEKMDQELSRIFTIARMEQNEFMWK